MDKIYIGIDVFKATLDVATSDRKEIKSFSNLANLQDNINPYA